LGVSVPAVYYAAIGSDYATSITEAVNVGSAGVRAAVESFRAIGADELIFHSVVPALDEIDKLADAIR
jgi:hypothetical protein